MSRAQRRRSAAMIAAAITAVVVAGGFGVMVMMRRPRDAVAPASYERATVVPTADAFETGGQPLADPAIAALLAGEFMQLVIETDADHASGTADGTRDAR